MYLYFKDLVFALVVLFLPLQVSGQVCATEIIKQLRAELGGPTKQVPAQLQKMSDVSSIVTLGSGHSHFGGTSYLVTFADGKKKVFKIYNLVNRGSMDLAAMKKILIEQEKGAALGFKIPAFKPRRDLGPQVMELEYVEGVSLYKILNDTRVGVANQEKLMKIYREKVQIFSDHFKAKHKAKIHEDNHFTVLEISGNESAEDLQLLIKLDNIIVTPNEEMYFIDPY